MKYRVHLYPVVRVALDVEADDPKSAIDHALDHFDPSVFRRLGDNVEFAEDYNDLALIDRLDETGDWIEGESIEWDLKRSAPASGKND